MTPQRTVAVLIGAVVVCTTASIAIGASTVANDNESDYESLIPADGPDYGVNSSDFYKFWSNDADDVEIPEEDLNGSNPREDVERALARSTDIPFEQPPEAAEVWTRGDVEDYSSGGVDASVAPSDAQLTSGPYIKDAFVSIAVIQPSTILHDTNGTNQTQYIAPDGEVLAVTDYRVAVPESEESDRQREDWSLVETSIESVTLKANGQTQSTTDTHRSALEYADLSGSVDLTVESTIAATLNVEKEICSDWNATTGACEEWTANDNQVVVEQTVSETQPVEVNTLSTIAGNRTTFEVAPDRVGAVVHPNTEWSTITVSDASTIRSNWWFYTAGTPGWSELVTHEANGSTTATSSVRPVQVHAFPSDGEPYVSSELVNGTAPLRIDEAWGEKRTGPELPPAIDLEPPTSYTNADSIALSSTVLDNDEVETVTVDGIVRGQSKTVSLGDPQTVRKADLELSVTEANATRAIIQATVTDSKTGDPVPGGRFEIGNQSVPLDQKGMASITVENPGLVVTGDYVPTEWWQTDHPYSSTDARTIVRTDVLDFRALVDLALVTLLWFLPVGLLVIGFDYVTDGELIGLTRHS